MIKRELAQWVSEKTGLKTEEIGHEVPLFSSGLLDSFELLEFVGFAEHLTGRRVGPIDINLKNFDTIGKVAAFFVR